MSAELKQDRELQIAHILFTDIVGYSKLLSDEQRKLFGLLNEIVRNTSQFRAAEAAGGELFGGPARRLRAGTRRKVRTRRLDGRQRREEVARA